MRTVVVIITIVVIFFDRYHHNNSNIIMLLLLFSLRTHIFVLVFRYHGEWRSETQSAVSLLTFMHWLETGNLLMHTEAEQKLGCTSKHHFILCLPSHVPSLSNVVIFFTCFFFFELFSLVSIYILIYFLLFSFFISMVV